MRFSRSWWAGSLPTVCWRRWRRGVRRKAPTPLLLWWAHEGDMRHSWLAWLLAALGAGTTSLAAAAVAAPHAGAPTAQTPAQWRSFDLLLDLQNLPRAYTCRELWQRSDELLLALGARHYPQILVYHCGATPEESSRSPQVQLQFQLPQALSPSQSRYADVTVVRRTIVLSPRQLPSFTAADCGLLKQLSSELFPQTPVRVVGAPLECPAPGAARPRYALEVETLMPRS